jgi:predicted DNA-binding transcriptional regulator AlpA
MQETELNPENDSRHDPFLGIGAVVEQIGVSACSIRNWIRRGWFPTPDANLFGRAVWLTSTVEQWRREALAGEFSRAPRGFFRLHEQSL